MSDDKFTCTVKNGLAIVQLTTPPMNLISVEMTAALSTILDTLAADDEVHALVLFGTGGKAFCAGSDIAEFDSYMQPGAVIDKKLAAENEMYSKLARFPRPTVAAVEGVAFGGGMELALCCDFIVADPKARFALPEVRLGVFPGSGGTIRILHRIGYGRAAEMIFLGDPIDTAKALEWGLINSISEGAVLDHATAIGHRLAAGALSVRHAKAALLMARDHQEDEKLDAMMQLIDQSFNSKDCREGVDAFREKRPPQFKGR